MFSNNYNTVKCWYLHIYSLLYCRVISWINVFNVSLEIIYKVIKYKYPRAIFSMNPSSIRHRFPDDCKISIPLPKAYFFIACKWYWKYTLPQGYDFITRHTVSHDFISKWECRNVPYRFSIVLTLLSYFASNND